MRLAILTAILLLTSSLALAAEPTKAPALATAITVYECKPQHYYPPCRRISKGGELVQIDLAELKAANDAATFLIAVRVGALDGPVLACANTHGASACCRVTHRSDDDGGTSYVECGPR